MQRRGQGSVELTAVLGIILIVILIFAVIASGILSQITSQQNYNEAYRSVQALAQAADSVYAQGEGASQEVTIVLPTNTNFDPSLTYIGRPENSAASPNTISININGTDVFAITNAPLSGTFPAEPGEYSLLVASRGRHVTISSHLIEAAPGIAFARAMPGEGARTVVLVKAVSGQRVRVTIGASWPYSSTEMAFAPQEFVSDGASSVPVSLNFTALANASGSYGSQLNITAYSMDQPERYPPETLRVPITFEVPG